MPRISTYNPDSSLSGEDKVIGSSYEGQDVHGPVYVTKNYTLSQLAQFFGSFIDTGDVLVNIQEIEQNVTNNTNAISTANQSITVIANEQMAQSTFQTNLSSTFGTFDSEGNLTSLSQAFADQVLQTTASERYANAQFVTNLAASVGTYDSNGNLVTLGQAFADQVLSTTASDRFATSTFATNLAASFGTYNPDGTLSTISSSFANQLLEASTESDFASATSVQNLGASFGTVNPDGSVSFTNTSTYASEILNYVDSSSALATQVSNLETTVTNIPQTIRQPDPPDVNAFPLGSIWVDTDDANAIYILTEGTPRTWEPTTSEALGDLILSNAALQEEVNLLSDDISAEATKLTTLTAQFGVYDPATDTFTINNNADVTSALRSYADSESAAATKAESVRAQVNDGPTSLLAQVSETSTAVADLNGNVQAAYGIEVDANGNIASMKLLADGTSGTEIRFRSDTFKIYNGTTSTAAFTLDGSELKLNVPLNGVSGTFTGTLQAGDVTVSNNLIEIDSTSGVLRFVEGATQGGQIYSSGGVLVVDANVQATLKSPTSSVNADVNGVIMNTTGAVSMTSENILGSAGTLIQFSAGGNTLQIGAGGVFVNQTQIGGALSGYALLSGANFTGAVTNTSSFNGSDFILNSDRSLKENIEDYVVKPIDINYKSYNLIGSEEKRVGVIAQELEVNHPEFVRENEEGIKSVSYIDMLVAKVAELEARIKELENGNTK